MRAGYVKFPTRKVNVRKEIWGWVFFVALIGGIVFAILTDDTGASPSDFHGAQKEP